MLLTIAFLCFAIQVIAWLLLPASAGSYSAETEPKARLEPTETLAA
jgi:hypothetical protein